MSTAHHRALNSVVNSYHPVATGDFGGVVAPFVQILDESMCVIREDICDWLQRYLFSEANVPPLDDACDLLERLKSGVWLARLAYKLHFKVLAANLPRCPRGVQVTSREHKLYASLRGTGPSNALGQLTAENLPPFSRPLQLAAEAQLSNSDVTTKVPSQTISDRYSTVDVGARLRIQWTARGNISAFLEWCRDLGISQTVLFETTGLVNRTEEKNVLLTLMDLARLASRFGLAELPELVRMEREIEALEAERLAKDVSTTKPVFPEDNKVDVSLYASRVADRRLSVSGVSQNPKSERRSNPRLVSTTTTTTDVNVNVNAATRTSATDRLLASTNTERTTSDCCTVTEVFPGNETTVIVEVSPDEDEKGVGTSDRATSTNRGTSIATATYPSDFVGNAACQVNSNNATREEDADAGSSLTVNSLTSTVFVDVDFDEPTSVTSSLVSSSPKTCPSATKLRPPRKISAPRNGATAARNQFGFAKRSTSAADLREISDPSVKRRNVRDSETSRGLRSQSRSREVTKSGIPTKAGLKVQNQRSRSHSRPPLAERDQLMKSQKPQVLQSFSSSPKLSSGFASRSSSCSDLAAEVRRQTAKCTCCSRNRLVRLDEGRYQMGSRIYYLRRFRSHIMVRVGGGWLTLPQFLDRYDPCRQKEGNLVTTGQSSTGDGVSSVRVPTANLLTSWPSTEAVNPSR